jgi:lipopolysaccharide/colanic/teichoic acid biosynthesis glycosyltransferase
MRQETRLRVPPPGLRKGLPRTVEVFLALIGLIISAPIWLTAMAAVAWDSRGPVVFRQARVGKHGRLFTLYKIRTMNAEAAGIQVTVADDPRITRVGRILRKMKIDELPGFWNVLAGDLSLVGPRPEVPRYVESENPLWCRVLSVRPGLTDPVTMGLRNEEALLHRVSGDRERFYRKRLLPFKLRGYLEYLERRTAWTDLLVLWQSLRVVFRPPEDLALELDDLLQGKP